MSPVNYWSLLSPVMLAWQNEERISSDPSFTVLLQYEKNNKSSWLNFETWKTGNRIKIHSQKMHPLCGGSIRWKGWTVPYTRTGWRMMVCCSLHLLGGRAARYALRTGNSAYQSGRIFSRGESVPTGGLILRWQNRTWGQYFYPGRRSESRRGEGTNRTSNF